MAWAIQGDDVNDFMTFTPITIIGDFTMTMRFMFGSVSASEYIMGKSGSTNEYIGYVNGAGLNVKVSSTSVLLSTQPVAGVWYDLTITRVGSLITSSEPTLGVATGNDTGDFLLDQFFKLSNFSGGGNLFGGQLEYVTITNSSVNINWDATASSHAAGTPILTDTISANNATGVNMPTDGSAWVDLGGSGISIAATLGTIEYNSNDTTIGLAGTVDVTATLGAINYSSNDALIQVSGDVNVIATLGAINYASNDTVISLFGNVDVTATLGTIDYNSNDTSVSLLGGINVNATLGAIDYASNDTVITLQGQVSVIATLGTISYDSNNVIVQIGTGQIIGNVTAGFADNLYSAAFRPSEITVNFKT